MKSDCKKERNKEMDPPQTKKQGHKGSKEKRNGFKGLHSGKGVRVLTENQSLGNAKKTPPVSSKQGKK